MPLASINYLRKAIINLDSVADTPEVVAARWLLVEAGAHKVPLRSIFSLIPREFIRFGEYISLADTPIVLRRD